MTKPRRFIALSVCAACLLSACGQPAPATAPAEFRGEIERLENEIGRLEFRVWQLENQLGEQAGGDSATAAGPQAPEAVPIPPPASAPQQQGRYDLTPVE